MQKNDFLCPKCKGHLRPADNIILSAKTSDGDMGLLLLSPQLGEYTITKHKSYKIKEGEHLEIFCPICNENLASFHEHVNLAKIIMIDEQNNKSEIVFSKIMGEKCTYKVMQDKVEPYGPDAQAYYNYWGVGPRY